MPDGPPRPAPSDRSTRMLPAAASAPLPSAERGPTALRTRMRMPRVRSAAAQQTRAGRVLSLLRRCWQYKRVLEYPFVLPQAGKEIRKSMRGGRCTTMIVVVTWKDRESIAVHPLCCQ